VPSNIFLTLSDIPGESVDPAHLKSLDIESFAFGGTNINAPKASFSTMDVTAAMDTAYPVLLLNTAAGKHSLSAVLSLCQSSAPYTEYSQITLYDVTVLSAQAIGATADIKPQVKYSFYFSKFEQSYWTITAQGTKGLETRMGWDVRANTAIY